MTIRNITYLGTAILIVTMLFASTISLAQESVELKHSDSISVDERRQIAGKIALDIGNRLEENSLFTTENADDVLDKIDTLNTRDQFSVLHKNLHYSFFRLTSMPYQELLDDFNILLKENYSKREASVAKLYNALGPISESESLIESFPEAIKILEPLADGDDWYLSAVASHFISFINVSNGDYNAALQSANAALSLIPNEISDDVREMRIVLTESIAYLHARLRDPMLTVSNTSRLIDLQLDAGHEVDGIMHINNLIYVFSHWRDHETTKALAKILLRMDAKAKTNTPGLTQMRLAQTMNEQNEFAEAYKHAEDGLRLAENKRLIASLTIIRIASLAGKGDVSEAEKELAIFMADYSDNSKQLPDSLENYVIYAQALIAFGKGNIELGQKLMTQRMDKYIQSTLKRSNDTSAELIATLENSKSRQIERQNALRREAELREAELKQKTFTNYLLIALSAILSIAAILSALFARYRSRSASRLRVARDQAKAGEKAKTEFLAIMSHELRTPLNGIIGIADLLATTAPTESLRQKNNIILESGNDLLGLVEGILDMSRIEAGEMGVDHDFIDVRKVLDSIDELWRPTIAKEDVVFTTFVDDSVPDLFNTDEKRMRQCLNNLISNATKFTKSGRIHIHVTATPAEIRGEMILCLIVADTGTGIREEVLDRLFQPFVQADASITRNYGGAGLGLAITRSLARMLGGDVHVVSREGRGSEFTLTFQGAYAQVQKESIKTDNAQSDSSPADSASSAIDLLADDNVMPLTPVIPAPLAPVENGLFSGLRVLIVEDVISNQDIIQIFLRPLGCQFVTANNGIEALRALEIYEFDLILMDIRMPEMDGIEASRRIRAHEKAFRDIPIIALTADKTEETQTLCKAAGVDLFLTKPVISKDLISAVRFVIEHPPRQSKGGLPNQQQTRSH